MRDLSLHLLDIIQNSVKAGATSIDVILSADKARDCFTLVVEDNGSGMDALLLKKVTDPFTTSRTTRTVGLGIPLLKESKNGRESGGDFNRRHRDSSGSEFYNVKH